MKHFSSDIEKLTRDAFLKRKGTLFTEIMLNWSKIIGTKYSNVTVPLKVTSYNNGLKNINVLHMKILEPQYAVHINYIKANIIERIEIFVGYKAINDIKVHL